MEKLTSYNYRKIINLVFLLVTVVVLSITTVIKNANQGNLMIWEMILSSSLEMNVKISAIIYAVLFAVIVIACLSTISSVLKKHNNSYFSVQGLISVVLVFMLLAGSLNKLLSSFCVVLLIIALIVNILATAYAFLIVKFNYDEIFNNADNDNKEASENEVVEEISDENK